MTSEPSYADRIYRSGPALAGGVLLLVLIGWLGGDAILRGDARERLIAILAVLSLVPLVVAFTLRPAVFASDARMRVRNPFRTIVLPWAVVERVRAGLSCEVLLKSGTKYQLWAIPVSLRQRKKANRRAELAARGGEARRPRGFLANARAANDLADGTQAPVDQAVDELNEIAERCAEREMAEGDARVRWSYEILAPAAVGLVALIVVLAVG